MNKVTADKIKLLRMVRHRIENQTEYFICNAIAHIIIDEESLSKAGEYLTNYISVSMNDKVDKTKDFIPTINTFDCWIRRYRPGNWDVKGIMIRQARLDWIDWMINCYLEDNK